MRNFLRDVVAFLKPYKKAIWSGLIAAVAAAWPLVIDGHVSASDVATIAGAFAAGAGIVYKVRNGEVTVGQRKAE